MEFKETVYSVVSAPIDGCHQFGEDKNMPTEYECEECQLTFVSGWCLTGKRHPGGLEFLVCKECGTQHKVESSPKSGVRFRVVAQPEPLTFFKSRTEIEDAFEPNANRQEWVELFVIETASSEPIDESSSELQFEDITCAHCAMKGEVISAMSDEDNCPRCKKDTLRLVMSWIT